MNKIIIIPLVSVGVLLSFIVVILGTQSNRAMDQQAASYKYQYQNQPMDTVGSNTRSLGNPPAILACTSIVANSNPPMLPSLLLPHSYFSPQEVIARITIESNGCTPGDATLEAIESVIYHSSSNYTRLSSITITDLSTGMTSPVNNVIYSFPLATARFKPGWDISQNGIRILEVRADLNLDITNLFPGDFIFTVMSNFMVNSSTGSVPVHTGGLSQQTMTY